MVYHLDEPTPEIAEIMKANERFYEAIENADLDLMRAVWLSSEEDKLASCVHPGQNAVHGVSKILRSWAVVLSRMSYLQFFITDLLVRVMGPVAVVTCVENVLSAMPGDDPGTSGFGGSHYEAVNVFKVDNGQWRLMTHVSAPVFPQESESPED